MFTGIIQDVGRIERIGADADQAHMLFSTHLDLSGWQLGDSIAVDGCCLTVTGIEAGAFRATLSSETLRLTGFGRAEVGQPVNLEPALRIGDALGGHFVTGHVDGQCELREIEELSGHRRMLFQVPGSLARYIVRKGSVAINGVSLTVNEVQADCFTVNLIPHTLSHTNLGGLNVGDRANLETDLMGRYVERLLACGIEASSTEES